jgi:glycosyltransferase involved in cell wall biosynthesis
MEKHRHFTQPISFSMLGWAYNEEENIAGYVERAEVFLRSMTDDFELILIDDGSSDGTVAVAGRLQKTRPWLRIFLNGRNRGPGFNTKRAIMHASKDYLFWQTVDWSYDISRLPANLHLLHEFDVLQGVRLDTISWRGLQARSDNPRKALISMVNYLLIRFLFRLPMHDYQNVTVYPTKAIQSVVLESESAFTNPECLLKMWWKGMRFKEIPVPFCKRQRGEGKGTRLKAILASIKDIFYWWSHWIVFGRRLERGRGQVSYWTEADERREKAARIGRGIANAA